MNLISRFQLRGMELNMFRAWAAILHIEDFSRLSFYGLKNLWNMLAQSFLESSLGLFQDTPQMPKGWYSPDFKYIIQYSAFVYISISSIIQILLLLDMIFIIKHIKFVIFCILSRHATTAQRGLAEKACQTYLLSYQKVQG